MTAPPLNPSAVTSTPTWWLIFAAWLIAAVATLGALFLGEVMKLPICVLCWYQRIFMFPMALILAVGLFPFERNIVRFALPLAIPGACIAIYHQLVISGVIVQSIQPCKQGVPCTETVIQWFGFVTIPLLSVAAFTSIVVLLFIAYFRGSK